MYRVCVDIAGFTIYWYGVMMMLGFLSGWGTWVLLGRSRGYDKAQCSDLLFWVIISGLLGARAAFVLEDLPYFLAHPVSILAFREGGMVFYGGFLGTVLALVIYARCRRLRVLPLLDLIVTGLPIAHALGRLGCLLNGCCYGSRTDGALGIGYPRYSIPWEAQLRVSEITQYDLKALPLHAVQMYEAGVNLLIFAVVVMVYRRSRRPGMTAGVYALLYAAGRSLMEHFRGDRDVRAAVGPLSIAQAISVGVALGGVALIAVGWRGSREAKR
jgi:phosphatidylglycerol:prolipoprotein diacylglycerol transferase